MTFMQQSMEKSTEAPDRISGPASRQQERRKGDGRRRSDISVIQQRAVIDAAVDLGTALEQPNLISALQALVESGSSVAPGCECSVVLTLGVDSAPSRRSILGRQPRPRRGSGGGGKWSLSPMCAVEAPKRSLYTSPARITGPNGWRPSRRCWASRPFIPFRSASMEWSSVPSASTTTNGVNGTSSAPDLLLALRLRGGDGNRQSAGVSRSQHAR